MDVTAAGAEPLADAGPLRTVQDMMKLAALAAPLLLTLAACGGSTTTTTTTPAPANTPTTSAAERRVGADLLNEFRQQFPSLAAAQDSDNLASDIVNSCANSKTGSDPVNGVAVRFDISTTDAKPVLAYLNTNICPGIDWTGMPSDWS